MPFIQGYLIETDGPVDPGYGRPGGGGGNRPDQGLPRPPHGPVDPGYGFPLPPVTVWPLPPRPNQDLPPRPPTYPVDPDYGLPLPPTVWPNPPHHPDNSLPVAPVYPSLPIYRPERPNNDLPMLPGQIWPPLPPELDDGKYLIMVWIPGCGYRWTVIDTSLKPDNSLPLVPPAHIDNSLPRPPARPDNTLPGQGGRPTTPIAPTPEPKRG